MNPHAFSSFRLSESGWRGIILALSAAVLLVTVWCLANGITTVFMHLYYFPIVLLAYRYRWKGFGLATLLAFGYLGLVLVFNAGQGDVILGAFYRFLVFVGIAAVVACLSDRLVGLQNRLQQAGELRARYINLAPAIILALDREGRILHLNGRGCSILGCSPEDAEGKPWIDTFIPVNEREGVRSVFSSIAGGNITPYGTVEGDVVTATGAVRVIRWHNTLLRDPDGTFTGTLSYGEDITDDKRAEDSLRKLQQFQESVIANANVWISVLAPDGTLLLWNDAAEAISGYQKNDVVGKNTIWKQLYPDKEYRRKVTLEIQRIIGRDEFLENFETEIRCADGSAKTVVWNTRGLRNRDGVITGYIAIGRDISAQKRAELRAAESARFLGTMIDTLPIPLYFKDADGKYLGCNPPFEEFVGMKRDQLIGKTVYDITPRDLADRYIVEDRQIFENPVPRRYETQVQYADGSLHDVIFYKAPFFNKDGSAGGLIGAYFDITERKQAERDLIFQNALFAAQNEVAIDGILFVDENQKILTTNRRFLDMWEVPPGLAAGGVDAPVLEHVLGKVADRGEFLRKVKDLYEHRDVKSRDEIALSDGRFFDRYSAPVIGSDERYFGRIWYFRDITETKKAEDAIRRSGQEWQSTFDAITDVVFLLDGEGRIARHNQAFERFTGKTAPEIEGRYCHETLHGTAYPICGCPNVEAQTSRKHESVELNIDDRCFVASVDPILDENGSISGAVHLIMDITDRKRAEEALRSSEARLHTLLLTIPDLIWLKNADGVYLSCNTMFERFFGARESDIVGKTDYDFVNRELADFFRENDRNAMAAGKPTSNEEWITFADDGHRALLETTKTPMYDARGTVIGVLGIGRDITDRKRSEEALRESRQLFSDIISFLPDPTFVIDKDGTVLAWNRAIEQLSGVSSGDIVGKGDYEYSLWLFGKRRPIIIDLVLHPDQDAGRLDYNDIRWEGRTVTAQTEITRPGSGHRIPLSLVASPLIDAHGKTSGAIESLRDISRLREAEAELARLNANLEQIVQERTRLLNDEIAQRMRAEKDVQEALSYTRSVIEANPDLMVVLDKNGTVLDVNTAAESMTGIPREHLIGTPYLNYLIDDGTRKASFSRLLEEGRIENTLQVRRTDGHLTPLSVNATVISNRDAPDARIIVAGHDITRQKQDEEAIKASLDEKVLLLREIHHRVKNNLQIIISLTNLQMRQTDDPGVKLIMSETQNRVRAMSLVHEKLYRSESLSRIDFADYTRFLATQLFSFYGTDTRRVQLELSMSSIMVDINTAVPLGLLMNELISNALKHAFPQGREGAISISGGYEGDFITLIVRDNGIGIPEELDWKNTRSLGMRLINSLIDQVDGTVILDRKNGTAFTITIKRKSATGDAA